MNCPECGGDTRVVDSRPREGGVWRRRKCAKAHLSYTLECRAEAPIKKVGRKKDEVGRKPKPLPKLKRKLKLPCPVTEEWNLRITDASPLWLRSMALKLG